MNTTVNLSLKKPGGTDPIDVSDLNENSDILDGFAGTVLSSVSALQTAVAGKADAADLAAKAGAADLAAEVTAREAADTALQTAVDSRLPLTLGTPMLTAESWDLFALPVGKYYRQSSVSDVANIPPGLTAAFYCIVENTISANRRRILLYPATATLAGTFYCCVETSTGFGAWFKFEGTAVS